MIDYTFWHTLELALKVIHLSRLKFNICYIYYPNLSSYYFACPPAVWKKMIRLMFTSLNAQHSHFDPPKCKLSEYNLRFSKVVTLLNQREALNKSLLDINNKINAEVVNPSSFSGYYV